MRKIKSGENRFGRLMTDTSDANKERNREIARNEEAKQVTGSIRVSTWAVAVVVIGGGILFTLGWLALRS
ncbi:hypothetical protein AYJ54_04740 [Bradyrhizobium centrolobii]|uniref:Uncharacterized protein n=1 Tax=Bradyrhizobium centrolobii TaxID=1505087 RepID=A0A176Y6S2_9BRAD|nr:hypothetical protein [Bradyrhizobium centrolobii]OAE98049.1 hypothetical protein AYJ54_04740 [Bradyrhizobium centrolobii]